MHYLLLFLLLAGTAFGQTRPIVPRADGEGSLGRSDKEWGHVYAKTGTFDSISLGGGNIEDVLFPLTKNADLGGFSLTNGATVEAGTGVFFQVSLGGTTNVLYDDGTNLLRNGVLIAGSGAGFPLTNTVNADTNSVPGQFGITNLSIVQAQTGVYDNITVGNIELTSGGTVSFGFENISGVGTLNAQQLIAATNLQSSGLLNVAGVTLLNDDTTIKGDLLITNDSRLRVYNTNATFNLTGDTITFSRTTNSIGTTLNMGPGGKIIATGSTNQFGNTTIQNLNIPGNLNVFGTQTVNQTTIVNLQTNVYLGTITNVVNETRYTTNIVYENTIVLTGTTTYVTNDVSTYVNIGGSFTMGSNSVFTGTEAKQVLFPGFFATNNYLTNDISSFVVATGEWDFSGATVSGLSVSGGGNIASLTSAWSVLYSDADTNSVSLALGADNTFLKSTGPSSAPVWASATDASTVTGIVNDIITASNLISASTASNIALEVSGSATNAYAYWDKIDGTNTLRITDGGGTFFDVAFSTNDLPTNGIDIVSVVVSNYEAQVTYSNYVPYTLVDTNVSGTWTIDFDAGFVQEYHQTGAITSIVTSTSFTNFVTTPRVVLLTDTNSITFPTNGWVWASGSYPTTANTNYNIFYLERSRFGKIHAVYVGTEDL